MQPLTLINRGLIAGSCGLGGGVCAILLDGAFVGPGSGDLLLILGIGRAVEVAVLDSEEVGFFLIKKSLNHCFLDNPAKSS